MNPLKKGPEIKLSSLKAPALLADVYYDLRDRHLLPLAAILVVAIVAVPIALSESSDPTDGATGGGGAAAAAASSTSLQTGQLIAEAAPGLRDYRRRLDELRAEDPFEQRFSGEGASSPAEESGSEPAPSSAPSEPSSGTAPGSEPQNEGTPGPGGLIYYSYAIDVRVVTGISPEDGEQSPKGKSTVRRKLPELTMLPSRETPALIYMGASRDGKKALMLVSSDVEALFGDAKCVLGSDRCELLAMEPGLPVTVVYGGAHRTFKIELLKTSLVETDKLNRAPLGKPKKDKDGGG